MGSAGEGCGPVCSEDVDVANTAIAASSKHLSPTVDLLQVLDCQMREDCLPDPVVEKRGLIFPKAETPKPPADIHRRAPHGLTG